MRYCISLRPCTVPGNCKQDVTAARLATQRANVGIPEQRLGSRTLKPDNPEMISTMCSYYYEIMLQLIKTTLTVYGKLPLTMKSKLAYELRGTVEIARKPAIS
jgi:hypothetical protein